MWDNKGWRSLARSAHPIIPPITICASQLRCLAPNKKRYKHSRWLRRFAAWPPIIIIRKGTNTPGGFAASRLGHQWWSEKRVKKTKRPLCNLLFHLTNNSYFSHVRSNRFVRWKLTKSQTLVNKRVSLLICGGHETRAFHQQLCSSLYPCCKSGSLLVHILMGIQVMEMWWVVMRNTRQGSLITLFQLSWYQVLESAVTGYGLSKEKSWKQKVSRSGNGTCRDGITSSAN